MPSTLVNRVKDTATTISGTGPYTLANAPPTGFRSFGAALGTSGQTLYKADDGAGNWETIKGTYTDSTKALTRDIFLDSSTGAPISWSAATPTVEIVAPSEWIGSNYHMGFNRARWYGPQQSTSLTSVGVYTNVLYAVPIYIADICTITGIGFNCASGGTGNCRMGLYSNVDGQPANLLVDCGTQAMVNAAVNAATCSQTADIGVIFAALAISATGPNVTGFNYGYVLSSVFGQSAVSDVSNYVSMQANPFTFGALPATFPAIAYSTAFGMPRLLVSVQ